MSGKIQISLDDKLRLEICKIKGKEIEANLVSLVDNIEKYKKEDRDWVKKELKNYMESQ